MASAALSAAAGELVKAFRHQLVELRRKRQVPVGVERASAAVEDAGELERVERIAARCLVDAYERRPGRWPVEALPQQPVERAEAQALERDRRQAIGPQPGDTVTAGRDQDRDRLRVKPREREPQRCHRRRVGPLRVVDDQQERLVRSESSEAVQKPDCDRTLVDLTLALVEEKRVRECRPLRAREVGERVVRAIEQVTETDEREPRLGLGRPASQHAPSVGRRRRDRRLEKRRLPDPGLADDRPHSSRSLPRPEQPDDRLELVLPADQVMILRHEPPSRRQA